MPVTQLHTYFNSFIKEKKLLPFSINRCFFLIILLSISLFLPNKALAQTDEHTLKAVLLERFTRFIEWEKQSESNYFNIVVIGSNEKMTLKLRKVYKNHKIQDKNVKVIQIRHLNELKNHSCDILYVSENMSKELEEITAYTYSKSILTIADTKNFARRGVVINFYIKNDSVQFKINTDAAKKANLQISYHLLKIADIVTELEP